MKKIIFCLLMGAACFTKAQTTDLIKDLNPGTANCLPVSQYAVLNNELYFLYNKELWKTDGTPAGTFLLKHVDVKSGFVAGNGLIFFIADDAGRRMLWKTDGTASGTATVGNGYTIDRFATELKFFNGNIFFSGCDTIHGCELWKSDGSDQGTYMLKDIDAYRDSNSSGPAGFFITNNKLYFSQNDSTTSYFSLSQEKLWETDGFSVAKVGNIFTYGEVIIADNKVYGISDSNYKDSIPSAGLYEIDLTTGSYSLIYMDFSGIYDPVWIGNKVLFIRGHDGEYNLYTLDIVNTHLEKIVDTSFIFKNRHGLSPNLQVMKFFVPLNNKFCLLREDNNTRTTELWQTDGTAAGTRKLLLPPEILYINDIVAVGNTVFLKAYDTSSKRVDIWYMDEQERLYRIAPNSPTLPVYSSFHTINAMLSDPLYVYDHHLVLTNLYDSVVGKELYKIDVGTLSVEKLPARHVAVYPNPAADFISVTEASVERASIIDNLGRVIFVTSEHKINVQHLAPGMYFIDIRLKNGQRRFAKFVKE